jgi:hypothetical protein
MGRATGRFLAARAAATVALAAALGPGLTHAAPGTAPGPARGLELVPASSAAVVRADPGDLERAAELVRSLGGEVGLSANLVSLASASSLGFDALARAGWRSIGVDDTHPLLVALAPVDATAPGALWHFRVVARVADPLPFAAWAVRIPLLGDPWQAARPVRGALASLLGLADARAEAAAARSLTARGTIAVGAIPSLGALLMVRRAGAYAAVDLIRPAIPLAWARDGARILARLDPPAAGAALGDRTSPGARALGRPGLVLWTQPGRLFDAVLAWRRPTAACGGLRELALRTTLLDGAATLRIAPRQVALEVVWSAASGGPLATAWPTAEDGLVGPPLRAGAILAASLYLAGSDRLRELPRPALVAEGWVPLWRRARGCGAMARAVLVSFAWPELAAQWLDEVAAVAPQAARLVGSLRNIGFAARRVSASDRRLWHAVLESSLAPAARATAESIFDAVFGGRSAARRPRAHTAWAGEFLRPYTLQRGPRGSRGAVVGVAIGEASRRWRIAQPLTRPRRGSPAGDLARAAGDAGALLDQLAPGLSPTLRAVAAAAATRVGSFAAAVTVRPDSIRASLTLRRR